MTEADKRLDLVRSINDAHALARMASIAHVLLDQAFSRDRAIKEKDGVLTFLFTEGWIEDIMFATGDVMERAAKIAERAAKSEGCNA